MSIHFEFEKRYLLGNTPWDSGVSPPELMEFIADHPPGRALEFGCGTGTNAITLAQHGWQVEAIDISMLALLKARIKAKLAGSDITFLRGDASKANEFEEIQPPYDLALDIGCFHALDESQRREYARQLPRLLAPGGTFLLYSFLDKGQETPRNWPKESFILTSIGEGLRLETVEHGHFNERPSAWFTFLRES
ncbi:MAG: class I SAM-dependent methyltransferase [Anaerolineales bacterium]